jgi:iron complex outermembrane recepter protein
VISGPGGTLWGANAVNGVINVITRTATETEGLHLEAGGGSRLRKFAGGRFGAAPSSKFAFRVYGKYFDRDEESLPAGTGAGDSWTSGRGGFRVDALPSSADQLTLQGGAYRVLADVPSGGESELSGGHALARWSRAHSQTSSFSLQAYFDRTHFLLPRPAAGAVPAGPLIDDLDTFDMDFHHRINRGRHRVVWGAGFRHMRDRATSSPSLRLDPEHLDRNLWSAFVQDQIQASDHMAVTFGTKIEHNSYTGVEVEPSVRLQWSVTSEQTLWAAVSRAIRTPSRIDRDFSQPTGLPAPFPATLLRGNPAFESEVVVAYEAGWRTRFGEALGGSLALFHNRYDSLRSTTPGPAGFPSFGFPLVFDNNLRGSASGAETALTWQPTTSLRMRLGHSYLAADLKVKPGRVDFSNALNETADPEHQIFLRASLDLSRRVVADLSWRWIDSLAINNGPNPGVVPSYAQFDARLGWRAGSRIELSIVGQNLLGTHPEHGFPGPQRIEVGRNIYATVSFRSK